MCFSQVFSKISFILSKSGQFLPKHPANSHHSWKAEVQEGSKKTADLNRESSWTKGPN